MAAALLLCGTIAVVLYRGHEPAVQLAREAEPRPVASPPGILEVVVSAAQASQGPLVATIEIGPPPSQHLTATAGLYPAELTMQRPASVTIAGLPGRDEDYLYLH